MTLPGGLETLLTLPERVEETIDPTREDGGGLTDPPWGTQEASTVGLQYNAVCWEPTYATAL